MRLLKGIGGCGGDVGMVHKLVVNLRKFSAERKKEI
jgi:hypothetical protein